MHIKTFSEQKIKDDITNVISETKEEIKKSGTVNRWIIIVGFIEHNHCVCG